MIAVGLLGLLFILAIVASVFAIAGSGDDAIGRAGEAAAPRRRGGRAGQGADARRGEGRGVREVRAVDPTLPAVPAGAVKKFTVDVIEHVTQVDPALAPTEAWTYTVNGKGYRGTAASPADRRQPGRQACRSRSSTAARRR